MFRRPPRALLAALILSLASGSAAFADPDVTPISDASVPATAPTSDDATLAPATDVPTAADEFSDPNALIASEFRRVPYGRRPPVVLAPPPYVVHPYGPLVYGSVSYHPRGTAPYPHSSGRPSPWHPVTQLHAGFLDPDGPATAGFDMGFRAGHEFDQVFQIGVGLDWRTQSGGSTQVLHVGVGPGGETIQTEVQLSHFSSNLLPVMLYGQVSGPFRRITPYVGGAGTWQVLFLDADDYATGQRFSATYSGFGWQAWGGVGLKLGRAKLIAEAFMNGGTVGRDITDPYNGPVVRETIRTDGIGARYGISWGF